MKSAPALLRILQIPLFVGLVVAGTGCNWTSSNTPSAEDFAAAREVMPIKEVLFKIRAGVSREEILAEVTRRHIPAKISAAAEAEIASFQPGPRLIAALKDDNNILTGKQQQAYAQLMAEADSTPTDTVENAPASGATLEERQASQRRSDEENELRRREYLAQENMRSVEQKQYLQAAQEREQANSVARFEGGRDARGRVYQQPQVYSTPVRRYSPSTYASPQRSYSQPRR